MPRVAAGSEAEGTRCDALRLRRSRAVGLVSAAVAVLVAAASLAGCGRRVAAKSDGPPLATAKAATGPARGLFAASEGNDSILVLDPATLRTRTMLSLGAAFPGQKMPHKMVVTPDHRTLLVTEYAYNALAFYDLDNRTLLDEVAVGGSPHGVALSPDGKLAYVAASADKVISVVDIATRKLVGQIPTQLLPWEIVVAPGGATAWVTSLGADSLVQVDLAARRIIRIVKTGEPYVVAAALLGDGRLLAGGHSSNKLFVIEAASGRITGRVEVGGKAPKLDAQSGGVSYFCTVTPIGGTMPVAIAPVGADTLLVADHGTNDLAVLSLPDLTVTGRIAVGADPQDVTPSPDGKAAYVTAGGVGELWMVDLTTRKTTARARIGPRPIGLLVVAP